MDVQRITDDLARGTVHRVYIVHGPERLLVSRAVLAIRTATVGAGARGLSEDHYDAADTSSARVHDACRMLPMLSRVRLVIVRGIEAWNGEEQERLLPYVNNPSPTTVLLLLATKLDGRTRFTLAVKKKNVLYEANGPSERDLAPWLEEEARKRGTSFAPGAAASLVLAVGADLSAACDALDRLQLFAAGRAITDTDVDQTVANVRESSQFELPDAIAERNLERALSVANQLVRQREPGLLVLAMIARQVRLLCRAREAVDRGEELVSALRVPPFVASKLATQVRRWNSAQLALGLRVCAIADERLKSGGGRDREARAIEELVLTLLEPGLGRMLSATT